MNELEEALKGDDFDIVSYLSNVSLELFKKDINEMIKNLTEEKTSVVIGKFRFILQEDESVRVIVETNKDHLQIKPSSGNAAILIACK